MDVISTALEGVKILIPQLFNDERGYFFESFNARIFQEHVGEINFCQDNQSLSHKNVIRGLHFQASPAAQSKLIRVVHGRVWDVAVDIRRSSTTFLKWAGFELSAENRQQLFLPKGFAHGFLALSENAVVNYKVDFPFSPGHGRGFAHDDPAFGISWPTTGSVTLSKADRNLPRFDQTETFD